jgi:hypothetical protein
LRKESDQGSRRVGCGHCEGSLDSGSGGPAAHGIFGRHSLVEGTDFRAIRSWRGSQDQAFEELCYQLRDPTPDKAELVKTGAPDGGLEWYFRLANGVEWGWQVKYTFDIETLLGLMEKSLRTVVKGRPQCRRLTFCIPFDLSDQVEKGKRKSARQKFEDKKDSWQSRIEGADRVKIELWSEGELLERLTNHPHHRGISWFFWHKDVFSPDWCTKRLGVTIESAGERYTPELHVELPIAFALEGLASSDVFWHQYRKKRDAVFKRGARIRVSTHKGLGKTTELRRLVKAFDRWDKGAPKHPDSTSRLDRAKALELTEAAIEACIAALPAWAPRDKELSEKQKRVEDRKASLRASLNRLDDVLEAFASFLRAPAAGASESRALLLTGEAGQGKTHLFCDSGERGIESGSPAVVLLGGQFPGRDVWGAIATQLGLPPIGGEALVGAMTAAAKASDSPFLLLIDALNEADDPTAWRTELPALLSEVADSDWIAVGFSLRSSFHDLVIREEGLGVAEVDHPGFQGRELEATERFFDHFDIEQPRVPLLTPEFTNPLFLKLYCEGLKGLGLTAPPDGEAHIVDVFSRYLDWKQKEIARRLKIDPLSGSLTKALDAFSSALVSAEGEHLPYGDASDLITAIEPGKTDWPNTLFGALLNEGILTKEMAWDRNAEDYIQVVRFSYQRLADFRAVAIMLDPFHSKKDLEAALAPSKPLREKIRNGPPGWIEALSVAMPERLGVELLDVVNWRLREGQRRVWDKALIRSVASRPPGAITDRTRELLARAQRRSGLVEEALEVILSVTAHPSHPLNANFLHSRLMEMPLADRDMAWSMPTYFAFADGGSIERLLRWAARGPHPDCPDEVLELVSTTIAWTFTSPNRRLRDYGTKALVRLISDRLPIVRALLERFAGVDDPYVTERLAAVAHGSVLIGGDAARDAAKDVAFTMRGTIVERKDVPPDLLSRDAVRGVFEWCLLKELVDVPTYTSVCPPYTSAPPAKPRTKKQLGRSYDRWKKDPKGNYIRSDYASLFFSLFDLGDFGRYVVGSKVREFTKHRIDRPIRVRRKRSAREIEKLWKRIEEELSPEQEKQLAEDPLRLTESLSPSQLRLLREAVDTGPPPDPKAEFPQEEACCWIFQRVLELGWTPERFDEWERIYATGSSIGRSEHKQERFGKKYQWIALRELLARVADNFHMSSSLGHEEGRKYRGPWQFFGRDLDPSLPPARRIRDENDELAFEETFPRELGPSWWSPEGPRFRGDDPMPPDDWARHTDDIPDFESMVRRDAADGKAWIVLHAYLNWDEEKDSEGEVIGPRRRDMWSHVKSWLTRRGDREAVMTFLDGRSFMNHWMPQGNEHIDGAYLGEVPWAESTREYPPEWRQIEPRGEPGPDGLELYPAWAEYNWEGSVLDCSIDEGIRVALPSALLFKGAELRWTGNATHWIDPNDETVAMFRSSASHSALLVQEAWLAEILAANGWSMIFALLGEKQMFTNSWMSPDIVGSWTEMNAVASLDEGVWTFPAPQFSERFPGGD